jgi:hypothetical protein
MAYAKSLINQGAPLAKARALLCVCYANVMRTGYVRIARSLISFRFFHVSEDVKSRQFRTTSELVPKSFAPRELSRVIGEVSRGIPNQGVRLLRSDASIHVKHLDLSRKLREYK